MDIVLIGGVFAAGLVIFIVSYILYASWRAKNDCFVQNNNKGDEN